MTTRYDAIVIGAGQAGPALAARLGAAGLKTAIIERKLMGGTCVNVGCIPTKTLVASAHAVHTARRGGEYGFTTGEVRVDMKAVKARKDGIVKNSSDGVTNWVGGMKNVTLIRGHARFTAPRTLDVDGRALQADKVFLNVGGPPACRTSRASRTCRS
jgi:pyruvate/2-oxoglutarate dehydrogenase complex dihydrolipoamide dehydrogenase (E3) component